MPAETTTYPRFATALRFLGLLTLAALLLTTVVTALLMLQIITVGQGQWFLVPFAFLAQTAMSVPAVSTFVATLTTPLLQTAFVAGSAALGFITGLVVFGISNAFAGWLTRTPEPVPAPTPPPEPEQPRDTAEIRLKQLNEFTFTDDLQAGLTGYFKLATDYYDQAVADAEAEKKDEAKATAKANIQKKFQESLKEDEKPSETLRWLATEEHKIARGNAEHRPLIQSIALSLTPSLYDTLTRASAEQQADKARLLYDVSQNVSAEALQKAYPNTFDQPLYQMMIIKAYAAQVDAEQEGRSAEALFDQVKALWSPLCSNQPFSIEALAALAHTVLVDRTYRFNETTIRAEDRTFFFEALNVLGQLDAVLEDKTHGTAIAKTFPLAADVWIKAKLTAVNSEKKPSSETLKAMLTVALHYAQAMADPGAKEKENQQFITDKTWLFGNEDWHNWIGQAFDTKDPTHFLSIASELEFDPNTIVKFLTQLANDDNRDTLKKVVNTLVEHAKKPEIMRLSNQLFAAEGIALLEQLDDSADKTFVKHTVQALAKQTTEGFMLNQPADCYRYLEEATRHRYADYWSQHYLGLIEPTSAEAEAPVPPLNVLKVDSAEDFIAKLKSLDVSYGKFEGENKEDKAAVAWLIINNDEFAEHFYGAPSKKIEFLKTELKFSEQALEDLARERGEAFFKRRYPNKTFKEKTWSEAGEKAAEATKKGLAAITPQRVTETAEGFGRFMETVAGTSVSPPASPKEATSYAKVLVQDYNTFNTLEPAEKVEQLIAAQQRLSSNDETTSKTARTFFANIFNEKNHIALADTLSQQLKKPEHAAAASRLFSGFDFSFTAHPQQLALLSPSQRLAIATQQAQKDHAFITIDTLPGIITFYPSPGQTLERTLATLTQDAAYTQARADFQTVLEQRAQQAFSPLVRDLVIARQNDDLFLGHFVIWLDLIKRPLAKCFDGTDQDGANKNNLPIYRNNTEQVFNALFAQPGDTASPLFHRLAPDLFRLAARWDSNPDAFAKAAVGALQGAGNVAYQGVTVLGGALATGLKWATGAAPAPSSPPSSDSSSSETSPPASPAEQIILLTRYQHALWHAAAQHPAVAQGLRKVPSEHMALFSGLYEQLLSKNEAETSAIRQHLGVDLLCLAVEHDKVSMKEEGNIWKQLTGAQSIPRLVEKYPFMLLKQLTEFNEKGNTATVKPQAITVIQDLYRVDSSVPTARQAYYQTKEKNRAALKPLIDYLFQHRRSDNAEQRTRCQALLNGLDLKLLLPLTIELAAEATNKTAKGVVDSDYFKAHYWPTLLEMAYTNPANAAYLLEASAYHQEIATLLFEDDWSKQIDDYLVKLSRDKQTPFPAAPIINDPNSNLPPKRSYALVRKEAYQKLKLLYQFSQAIEQDKQSIATNTRIQITHCKNIVKTILSHRLAILIREKKIDSATKLFNLDEIQWLLSETQKNNIRSHLGQTAPDTAPPPTEEKKTPLTAPPQTGKGQKMEPSQATGVAPPPGVKPLDPETLAKMNVPISPQKLAGMGNMPKVPGMEDTGLPTDVTPPATIPPPLQSGQPGRAPQLLPQFGLTFSLDPEEKALPPADDTPPPAITEGTPPPPPPPPPMQRKTGEGAKKQQDTPPPTTKEDGNNHANIMQQLKSIALKKAETRPAGKQTLMDEIKQKCVLQPVEREAVRQLPEQAVKITVAKPYILGLDNQPIDALINDLVANNQGRFAKNETNKPKNKPNLKTSLATTLETFMFQDAMFNKNQKNLYHEVYQALEALLKDWLSTYIKEKKEAQPKEEGTLKKEEEAETEAEAVKTTKEYDFNAIKAGNQNRTLLDAHLDPLTGHLVNFFKTEAYETPAKRKPLFTDKTSLEEAKQTAQATAQTAAEKAHETEKDRESIQNSLFNNLLLRRAKIDRNDQDNDDEPDLDWN